MNDEDFNGLVGSMEQAIRWARGEPVDGLRVHSRSPLDIAAIRKRAGLTQTGFARQIGVSPGTPRPRRPRSRATGFAGKRPGNRGADVKGGLSSAPPR
jgi:hypothetical protein